MAGLAVRQAHRLSDSAPILSTCDDPFGSEDLCWAAPGSDDMALHDAVETRNRLNFRPKNKLIMNVLRLDGKLIVENLINNVANSVLTVS